MYEPTRQLIGFLSLFFFILGIFFVTIVGNKPNTDDLRESPSLVIIPELNKLGVHVQAHDPAYKKSFEKVKQFKKVKWKKSIIDAVKDTDMILIHTEWNEYRGIDLKKIKKLVKNKVILDLRNIFNKDEVVDIGFTYKNIGQK